MKTLLKYKTWMLGFLLSHGLWGLLLACGLDGAGVPLAGISDFIFVSFVFHYPRTAWLLAGAGSATGCMVLYLLGYLGGELVVEKRMSKQKFEKFRTDFEEHPVLTLLLPAVLPPPFPLKIFVLAAGAFEMRWWEFAPVILGGRLLRFGALSLLALRFGPEISTLVNQAVRRHLILTMMVLAAFLAALFVVHNQRRRRRRAANSGG